MDKLKFPKGSLKFKKIGEEKLQNIEKTDSWKKALREYAIQRQFVKKLEKEYPGDQTSYPQFIQDSFSKNCKALNEFRKKFKTLTDSPTKSTYEITFNHPKWSKIKDIGEIKVTSPKEGIKAGLQNILTEFQKRKENYRKMRSIPKTTRINSLQSDITYNLSAGAIYMPKLKQGVFIKFLKDQEKKIVFSPKTPKETDKNYVGVELEFFCDWHKDELGVELYDIGVGKNVTLKTDGSIRPEADMIAHELCIIAKEDEYLDVIEKVCKVLSKANAQVNKSCGMHVHLDMRNRDADKAYQNLVSSQGILYRMNPKSRGDEYAKRIQERDFNTASSSGQRYFGINATAHRKHKTIECRIHSGTVDFRKITNWIAILIKIANHSSRIVKTFVGVNTFCQEFGIEGELESYINERINKFKAKKLGLESPEAERGVA